MWMSKGAGKWCSGWKGKIAYFKGNEIKLDQGGVRYQNCVLWRRLL